MLNKYYNEITFLMLPILFISNYLKSEQLGKQNQRKEKNQKRFIDRRGICGSRFTDIYQDINDLNNDFNGTNDNIN